MVFYRTGSKSDAEDLTQEIFIKMLKNIKKLRDSALFKSWLYRIATNKITDYYRKKALLSIFVSKTDSKDMVSSLNEEELNSENPSKALQKKEFYLAFFHFTKKLGKREKEVFLLRFIDQLSIKEISQVLSKNQSTIKTHLYRAIQKFRDDYAG